MTDSYLLYPDSSTEGKQSYAFQGDIIKDMNLNILFRTMAREDVRIAEKARKVIMVPLTTPEEVYYRHAIIKDFENSPGLLEELYRHAAEQQKISEQYRSDMEKNRTRTARKSGEMIDTLHFLSGSIQRLLSIRETLEKHYQQEGFRSEGLLSLRRRLNEEPLDKLAQKIKDLHFYTEGGEVVYHLQFCGGMKIGRAVLCSCVSKKRKKREGKMGNSLQNLYWKHLKKDTIPLDSEALKQDIGLLTENTVMGCLELFAPFLRETMAFFEHFAEETAFYKGVLNLMQRMSEISIPLSMPEPKPAGSGQTAFRGLYELTMAIYMQNRPVTNDADFDGTVLTVITGANQGGKSTFLRSYGIAQILMQCGIPVPAAEFSAPLYPQIFTHFTRREDEKLNHGRLQEELGRMSAMIQAAVPDSLFLLNESFASTTEKEGSRIADGIIRAFYEKGITTMMVTHLFEFARSLYRKNLLHTKFLTAERREDGTRTFRIIPGEPNYTSYGTDLFEALIP